MRNLTRSTTESCGVIDFTTETGRIPEQTFCQDVKDRDYPTHGISASFEPHIGPSTRAYLRKIPVQYG